MMNPMMGMMGMGMNPLSMGMGGLGGLGMLGGLGGTDPMGLMSGLGGPDTLGLNGTDPDHLVETKARVDDYLTKQYKLGKRKLSVQVNYGNMPLEYQFLQQYHGFKNPLVGTPLAHRFGLPGPRGPYRNRKKGPKNPMFNKMPSSWSQPGYGAPPMQPGYGPPPKLSPQGYGPPPPQGYGPMQPSYPPTGYPPLAPGYPAPAPPMPGYPAPAPGYSAPPAPGYPAPPASGYPAPPAPGYAPPPSPGYAP